MMSKKLFFTVLTIILFSTLSHAFQMTVSPVQLTVRAGSGGYVTINITSDVDDRFIYHINGMRSWMTVEDIGRIEAGKTKSVKFYFSPTLSTQEGTYRVTIEIESLNTGDKKSKDVYVTVKRDIIVLIDKIYVTGSLKPLSNATLEVILRNAGTVSMNDLDVKMDILHNDKTFRSFEDNISLEPGESKTIRKIIEFPSQCDAGRYKVHVDVYYKNEVIASKDQFFDVASVPVIVQNVRKSPIFIGSKIRISVINLGNTPSNESIIKYPIGSIEAGFVKVVRGPKPEMKDGTLIWTIPSLKPAQGYEIVISINYLPLILLILVILFALYFVLFKVKVVQVNKIVSKHKNYFTISIEIKNKTGKPIDYITIEDKVPVIFKVKSMTGSRPKIKKFDYFTGLTWKIRRMKPDEERIISYRVIPVVEVEGSVHLPRATVEYKIEGKKFKAKSNTGFIE